MRKITKYSIVCALSIALGATGAWWYTSHARESIDTYNPAKDRAFILDLFKHNWYWLVSEYSHDFSAEYMLDHRTSSRKPQDENNLTIKVYHKGSQPVGFTAYYTKALFEGTVLFLAVDEAHRSKGYARKLLAYAIDDLKKRGCVVIRLITRTNNLKAQKVYKGMGFIPIWNDEGFVKFEKKV